jgi:glycerophosphoryl diester phosphodiesterase
MISHALGTVDGVTYTNSREAFTESIHRGFQWLEVDLVETHDGKVVACHTLGPLRDELGRPERIGGLPYQTFMQSRLFGKYSPLDLDAVLDLLEQHPTTRLVIDVKNSQDQRQEDDLRHSAKAYQRIHQKIWALVQQRNAQLLDRLYPQIYTPKDLDGLRSVANYKHAVFTTYRYQGSDREIIDRVRNDPFIHAVAFEKKRFRASTATKLRALGKDVWVFVENDPEAAQTLLRMGVTGFYTDYLPADFALPE